MYSADKEYMTKLKHLRCGDIGTAQKAWKQGIDDIYDPTLHMFSHSTSKLKKWGLYAELFYTLLFAVLLSLHLITL